MKINYYNDPWDHFEVKDFLTEAEFNKVKALFKALPEPQNFLDRVTEWWDENGEEQASQYPNGVEIHRLLISRFSELLEKLPISYDKDECSIHIEFDKISPEFEWPIHNDVWIKLVSVIIHISDTGNGTRLYSENDENTLVRTVNWIPRGGGGFIRDEHKYHSFDTLDTDTNRETIILTLRENKDWQTGEPLAL